MNRKFLLFLFIFSFLFLAALDVSAEVQYNFYAEINWGDVHDYDLYVKTPRGKLYYYGASLDETVRWCGDVYPNCATFMSPLPPECLDIFRATEIGTYEVWYNQYSKNCTGGSVTSTVMITAIEGSIKVNGQILTPGQQKTFSNEIPCTGVGLGNQLDASGLPTVSGFPITIEEIGGCVIDDDCLPNPNVQFCDGQTLKEHGACLDSSVCGDKTVRYCGEDELVVPAKYTCSGLWKKLQQKIKRSCYNESCRALYSYGEGAFTSCNGGIYWEDEEGKHFIKAEGPCSKNASECPGGDAPCYCPGGCSENPIWEDMNDDCPKNYKEGGFRCSGGNVEEGKIYYYCQTNADGSTIPTCDKSYTYWTVAEVCGNKCIPTGQKKCGGAVSGLLGEYPASVEEEWQCSFCVEGNENCVIWPDWRVLWPCWSWGSTSVFCAGNNIWKLQIDCPGNCAYVSPIGLGGPTCVLGNPTGNPNIFDCEKSSSIVASCLCGCSGWLNTSFPTVIGPGIICKQTGVCSPGATQPCGKGGTQTCSATCGWGSCQNEGVCTPGEERSCACGGTQICNSQYQWDPCQIHKECEKNAQGQYTGGCVCIGTPGNDSCTAPNQCEHNDCDYLKQTCLLNVPGPDVLIFGKDNVECQIDTNCPYSLNHPPTVEDLVALPETYCIAIPGCGEISFQWTYHDQDSNPESRFDIQVDNNSDFSSPEVDRTFVGLSEPDGSTNTQLIYVRNFPTSPGGDYITFDQSYYVRVRVWDNTDLDSGWVNYYDPADSDGDGNPATFFKDPHPWSDPEFRYLPSNPNPNEEISFTDLSICYDDNKNPYPCKITNPITGTDNEYIWTFGDGTPGNNDVGDTSHTYTAVGIYPVTLKICDCSLHDLLNPANGCCQVTHDVLVGTDSPTGGQTPEWKEISPF